MRETSFRKSSAGITWKRLQQVNPKTKPEVVKKQEEIQKFIGVNQPEIESESLVVLFVDGCQLGRCLCAGVVQDYS